MGLQRRGHNKAQVQRNPNKEDHPNRVLLDRGRNRGKDQDRVPDPQVRVLNLPRVLLDKDPSKAKDLQARGLNLLRVLPDKDHKGRGLGQVRGHQDKDPNLVKPLQSKDLQRQGRDLQAKQVRKVVLNNKKEQSNKVHLDLKWRPQQVSLAGPSARSVRPHR